MKESQFIKQSEKKWKNFEEDLKLDRKNPERTSKLFIQITDDLSYARTFYPNRMVRKYLDGVSQILLGRIYKNQRFKWSNFLKFWSTTLPLEVFRARRTFTIAIALFVFSFLIGVLSAYHEPEFVRVILGDGYVDMTLENIENNDPMAVYKDFNATEGFVGITINNIRVAFMTFASGLLAAIGSVYILLYNGIMVGAFQYFFLEQGVFLESLLTIWQHGTIEISAIVIAGAAGLTMGRGLIFTGSYTRLQSFKISGKRGLIIFLGTVPLFIIAGFIEGFLTRFTEAPLGLRLSVIISSALFIFYYFGWYPRKVGRSNAHLLTTDVEIEESIPAEYDPGTIYNSEDLVRLSFTSLLKKPGVIFMLYILSGGLAYLYMDHLDSKAEGMEISDNWLYEFFRFLDIESNVLLASLLAAASLLISMVRYSSEAKETFLSSFSLQKLLMASLLFLPVFHSGFWLITVGLYPVMAFIAMNSRGFKQDLTTTGLINSAMKKAYLITGLMLFFAFVVHLFFTILNAQFLVPFYEAFTGDYELSTYLEYMVYYTSGFAFFLLAHTLTCGVMYRLKYTSKETLTAGHLMEKIKSFELKHNLRSEDA